MCLYVDIYIYNIYVYIYIHSTYIHIYKFWLRVDQLGNSSGEGSLNNIKMESSEANNKTVLYTQLLFKMLINSQLTFY